MAQLLGESSGPEVHGGSRDSLVQYRRLVESATKFVDVYRRLTAIDSRLRQSDKRYSTLVDDLHGLESLLASLDDESALERRSLPVLQVSIHSYSTYLVLHLFGPRSRSNYEGRSNSFAIQYDVQMAQTKQLHYFSMQSPCT